jgi:peptide deformylase
MNETLPVLHEVLPITIYGNPVLREKCSPVNLDANEAEVASLLTKMWATMYGASGVGLAAPQVANTWRIFTVDAAPMADLDEVEDIRDFKRAFVNPVIEESWGPEWGFEEGCLSIPGIRDTVYRPEWIRVRYLDENLRPRTEEFRGIKSRIIQHEYDHIEGKLFTDRLSAIKRQLIRNKLARLAKGNVSADYPVVPPVKQ